MFTGIIQQVGAITDLQREGDWTVTIAAPQALSDLVVGASVACSGICLTVVEMTANSFTVRISAETLSKTTALHWRVGSKINLERALRFGDELGGHLLLGHVDGVAKIISREEVDESIRFWFEVPQDFARFLAPKGSIALDGISLTVNHVQGSRADVNIIPHTQEWTNISTRQVGDEVNFEVDMLARYIDRLLENRRIA